MGRDKRMSKLQAIDGKTTNWEGLWWHPEYNGFSSAAISLSELRKFKGQVRLYVRKNKFFNNGENSRPNYNFCLRDADSSIFRTLDVMETSENEPHPYRGDDGNYYTEDGERLYTGDDARAIINGTFADVKYGISDPYDILPEDFV